MQDKTTQNEAHLSKSLETAAAAVAERCFQDQAFGKSFLENPKSALAAQNIDTGPKKVHVHENDARNWHIVLPHLKVREAMNKYTAEELETMKDSEMKQVSGGEIAFAAMVATAAIATTATAVGVTAVGAGAVGTGVYFGTKKKKKK